MTTTWPRLSGLPAYFGVRTMRNATIEDVRAELERTLGVIFQPDTEDPNVLASFTKASTLRLSDESPTDLPKLRCFMLTGEQTAPPEEDDGGKEDDDDNDNEGPEELLPEDISQAVCQFLLAADCDWYIPNNRERQADANMIGERLLKPDVLFSIVAPFWMAHATSKDRARGNKLVEQIVERWLVSARRTADPVTEVQRYRSELRTRALDVPPRERLRVLAEYADSLSLDA